MKTKLKVALAIGATAAAIGATVAIAGPSAGPLGALGLDDNETPIQGAALTKASEAALKHVGGGRVSETEVGDEEGYYEVEVTRPDGSQVDVHLAKDFSVLGQVRDEEDPADRDR